MHGRGGRARGVSLIELLTVLVIVGILSSLAAPPLHQLILRARVRGAMLMLRADLSYARMAAARSGHGAVVYFIPSAECASAGSHGGHSYVIRPRGPADRPQTATLRLLSEGVCLGLNGGDSLVFASRGILAPFNNRTLWTAQGSVRDSITVSVAGRILARGR